MAKRTNRVAWSLAAILAMVVLGGGVLLVTNYQRRLPEHQRRVILLPWRDWCFDRMGFAQMAGPTVTNYEDWYYCGFFVVRVKRPPPAGLLAAPRSGKAQ